MIKKNALRKVVQIGWTALTNGYLTGYFSGKIYTGRTKSLCAPGLNCYSCPGALGSCPIGSFQATINNKDYHIAWYIIGILMFIGSLFGRFVCGWLCPFGLVQDLLYKIPSFKKAKNLPGHKILTKLKYLILAVTVILLPMIIWNSAGVGQPWFCEYICPSGALMGGIPLVIADAGLRAAIGWRFYLKIAILVFIVVLAIGFYRPFCKYLCPLGAVYGFFNPIALYRFRVNSDKCVSCGACQKACKMDIKVWQTPNSMECIRCGDCKSICPEQAIESSAPWKASKKESLASDMTRGDRSDVRPSAILGVLFLIFGCAGTLFAAVWFLPQTISLPMELTGGMRLGFLNGAIASYSISTIIMAAMGLIIVLWHKQSDGRGKLKVLHLLSCASLVSCILLMIKSPMIYNIFMIIGIIPVAVLLLVYTGSYGFQKFKKLPSWKALLTGVLLVLIPAFLFTGYTMYSYLEISAQSDRYAMASDFKKFEADCLDGRKINQDIFSNHKLTMVNCWETTCGPCIDEMPSLQEIYEERDSSDFTIIGICYDCASGGIVNESILSDAKAIVDGRISYPIIIPTADLDKGILNGITAFPTTFFVDSERNVIKTVMGANEKQTWENIIDECLKTVDTETK